MGLRFHLRCRVRDGWALIPLTLAAISGSARAQCEREWRPLGTGINGGNQPSVLALTVYGGEVIAGGIFTTAGGVPASNVARWDGSTWRPLGSGVSGGTQQGVYALGVYNGELVAGGNFTLAGGARVNHIARWDGQSWRPFGSGVTKLLPVEPHVGCVAVYNGELVAGGIFTHAGDVEVNNIAAWNGSSWRALGAGVGPNDPSVGVAALTLFGGALIAGGFFATAGGARADAIAAWDGAAWHPLGAGVGGFVAELGLYDGDLIAAGNFAVAGGVAAHNIAAWNGSAWRVLGAGTSNWIPGAPGSGGPCVRGLAVFDGAMIAGGDFAGAGGVAVNRIARWDGATWTALGGGLRGSGLTFVWGLLEHDGDLIAGGAFSQAGASPAANVARWTCACYANCDQSTSAPVLNLNDFVCFAGRFAGGDPYANCDGSTTPPALNIADFVCFMERFAAGCQ